MNYYERLTEEYFTSLLRELYGSSGMLRERPSKLYNEEIKENNNEMKQGLKVEITNKNASYGDSRSYVYYIDDKASFLANQMPYPKCCGIAILKDISVYSRVDKADGIKIIDAICEDLYKNDKYSKILFYTNVGSESAKLFEKYPDITILDPFKNRRSGNILIGFEINLLKNSDVNPESRVTWRSALDEEDEEENDDDEDSEEDDDEEENDDDEDSEEDDDEEDKDVTRDTVAQQAILDGFPEPTPDVYDYGRRSHLVYGSSGAALPPKYRSRLSAYIIEPDSNESTNTR